MPWCLSFLPLTKNTTSKIDALKNSSLFPFHRKQTIFLTHKCLGSYIYKSTNQEFDLSLLKSCPSLIWSITNEVQRSQGILLYIIIEAIGSNERGTSVKRELGEKVEFTLFLNILSEYGIKTTKHSFILKGYKGNRIFRKERLACAGEKAEKNIL